MYQKDDYVALRTNPERKKRVVGVFNQDEAYGDTLLVLQDCDAGYHTSSLIGGVVPWGTEVPDPLMELVDFIDWAVHQDNQFTYEELRNLVYACLEAARDD
jgi:hypothetical protein